MGFPVNDKCSIESNIDNILQYLYLKLSSLYSMELNKIKIKNIGKILTKATICLLIYYYHVLSNVLYNFLMYLN